MAISGGNQYFFKVMEFCQANTTQKQAFYEAAAHRLDYLGIHHKAGKKGLRT
jgi:hypothetical protein